MKSVTELEDIVYGIIDGSALHQAITSSGGCLYTSEERPDNSAKEDIVISVLDGLNGQIQNAVINVNIYIPMKKASVGFKKNRKRINDLSQLSIALLEEVYCGDFCFILSKQPVIRVSGVNEHCINNRLELQIINY